MRRPRDRYHNNIGTPLDGMNASRYVDRMNNKSKPGAVLPPANFYIGLPRDNAVAGRMHVSDLDFVETLFSDDEAIGDREEYFDTYAFRIWNQQEHNEYDCALQHLIWEAYNTADY